MLNYMAENPNESEFYLALLAAIEDNYSPAADIPDADILLSTNEIIEKLSDMLPGIDPDSLIDFLHSSGYKFSLRGEMDFAWLLKSKK